MTLAVCRLSQAHVGWLAKHYRDITVICPPTLASLPANRGIIVVFLTATLRATLGSIHRGDMRVICLHPCSNLAVILSGLWRGTGIPLSEVQVQPRPFAENFSWNRDSRFSAGYRAQNFYNGAFYLGRHFGLCNSLSLWAFGGVFARGTPLRRSYENFALWRPS